MTARRHKKVKKYRGSKTHGCGSMKKRRGAGNRGGRGNAGSGKRGDANKQSFIKSRYFGKKGFKKKGIKPYIKTINLSDVEKILASAEKDIKEIDLVSQGYTKLLGNGNISKQINIKILSASKSAIEKVKAAGGNVVCAQQETSTEEE